MYNRNINAMVCEKLLNINIEVFNGTTIIKEVIWLMIDKFNNYYLS